MSDHHASDPFHIAVPVHDLALARAFYGELLGCPEGRSADTWVDYDIRNLCVSTAQLNRSWKRRCSGNPFVDQFIHGSAERPSRWKSAAKRYWRAHFVRIGAQVR
jgi:hypothetical protein